MTRMLIGRTKGVPLTAGVGNYMVDSMTQSIGDEKELN